MNKLFCSLAFLLSFLPAAAQLRVTQSATSFGVGGSPMATAFPAAPAPGDLLVVLIGYYTGATLTPPYGWTALPLQAAGPNDTTLVSSYYHFVAPGETNSVVFGQNNNSTMTVYDIAGADIYNPFNNAAAAVLQPVTASATTPSLVPTVAGTLPIAAIAGEHTLPVGTTVPGWKFTPPSSPFHPLGSAYGPLTTSTVNSVDSQFTVASPDSYALAAATILVNPTGTTGHTPTANPGGPYTGVTSFGIDFDGSASTDPRSEALTYAWNFGDGTTGTGVRPSHVYATTGSYNVSLVVTDVDGNIANASTTVGVNVDCSSVALGNFGALNKFVPSPGDAWHQDISGAPVDPMSQTILVINRSDLAGSYLHPDFGSHGAYGIPYTVVDSSVTASVPINVQAYADESDVAVYPIPSNMPVEGSPADCSSTGDNHAIVFDKHTCAVHELYHAQSCSTAPVKWSADASTIWDLTKTQKRPYGITSVDAAGLSVFEGLVRYDEIVAGYINHAIRFTAQFTKNNTNDGYFAGAATHAAGTLWGTDNIEGMRIRLKANYDISTLSPQAKIIATAMKQYGMILADNGSNLYFQGTPDLGWNDDDLNTLKSIPASAFEVINQSLSTTYAPGAAPMYPNGPIYDSVNHPTGTSPAIVSFSPSAATISIGQSVTLNADVSGASYSYIDQAGLVRGPMTVSPTQTTTYTLTSRNAYGTTTATTTVTVQSAVAPSLSLAPIPEKTFGSGSFAVQANSNSTGAITYAILSGPAMVSGTTVTLTGTGQVTVQASQVAAGNYTAATTQVSFNVDPAVPTLALHAVANQTYGAAPFTVSAISNSPAAMSYSVVSGPATVSGNTVSLNGLGNVVLQVTQAASGNYAAATATTSFTVLGQTPQLTFSPIANQTLGVAPFPVTASSASRGQVTYAVVSGPANVFGSTLALTGTGTVTLQANQAAWGNYATATATTSFTVNPPASAAVTLQFESTSVPYLSPIAFNIHIALSNGAMPTGTVQLFDGSVVVGSYPVTASNRGQVQGTLLGLLPGQQLMSAIFYSSDRSPAVRSQTIVVTVGSRPVKLCTICGIRLLPSEQ